MIPKDDLFELIKSLSPNEKRYFRIKHSGREVPSSQTNHIKLFEAINSQKQYDESLIKEKFKNERFIKQLTFTKNYLYNEIINTLIEYRRSSSSETQLLTLILKLRALFKRGLFKQYFKQLESARKKAWEYEKFYVLLEILRMSRLIMNTKKYRSYTPDHIYSEEESVLRKIENISQYSRLFNKAIRLKRQLGVSRRDTGLQKTDKLLNDPLLKDHSKALCTQSLEYFYHIKQVLYSIKGDIESQRRSCIKRLSIIEGNPKPFMDDIINVRKEVLYALIDICICSNDKESSEKYLSKYISLSKSNLAKLDIFILEHYMKLVYMVSSEDFTDGEKIIKDVNHYLIKYKDKLNRDTELESMFLIIKYYFLTGRFDKALDDVNRLLGHPILRYRRDIYICSRVMNILIHFELGNYTLIEYLIDSLKKTLKAERDIYERELIAIEIIATVLEKGNVNGHKFILNQEDTDNQLYYFDALKWVINKFNLSKPL